MSTVSKIISPPTRLDAEGRLIPLTEEEQVRYVEAVLQMLDTIAAIPNDLDEDDRDFFRAFDESHPDRPSFTGMY